MKADSFWLTIEPLGLITWLINSVNYPRRSSKYIWKKSPESLHFLFFTSIYNTGTLFKKKNLKHRNVKKCFLSCLRSSSAPRMCKCPIKAQNQSYRHKHTFYKKCKFFSISSCIIYKLRISGQNSQRHSLIQTDNMWFYFRVVVKVHLYSSDLGFVWHTYFILQVWFRRENRTKMHKSSEQFPKS